MLCKPATHLADRIGMMRMAVIDDVEGIEGIVRAPLALGGVDPCIDDREAILLEVFADARQQIGLVGCIDRYLESLPERRQAGTNAGLRAVFCERKRACDPG